MTAHTDKAEIVAAANTVPGVNASTTWRQMTKPGNGSVLFSGVARADNGFGWIATWTLTIAIPQDLRAAETWLDEHTAPLIDAIDGIALVITTVDAQTLILPDTNAIYALVITGTRLYTTGD